MRTRPVLRKLPTDYLTGIGAVCFEWAQVERALQMITYGLLQIGPKHGRVAVRSPRATDQINMIKQLMGLEKLSSEHVDLDALSLNLGKLEKWRDALAHGIWLEGETAGKVFLQDLSGTWKPDPRAPKVARRIMPEGVLIDPESLLGMAKLTSNIRLIVEGLAQELEAKYFASRGKPRPPRPEDHQPQDHKSDKP